MSCCKTETKVEVLTPASQHFGPTSKRSCRDIPCLLVFVAFLGGVGALAYFAIRQGNPYRLVNGVDSWGNVCGKTNHPIGNVSLSGQDLTQKAKLFFFDPTYFLSKMPGLPSQSLTKVETVMVCVEGCPDNVTNSVLGLYTNRNINLCRYDVIPYVDDETKCPKSTVPKHKNFFNRCIPETIVNMAKSVASAFTSTMSNIGMGEKFTEKVVSDLKNTWPVIAALAGIAVGVALVVVVMMKLLAAVIVWTLVFVVILLSLGATGYCWYVWQKLSKAFQSLSQQQQTDEAKQTVLTWLIYACVTTGISVILLLILLVMRKRIKLVVELFKESGRAIGSMPLLLIQPLWTLLVLIVVVGLLCLIAVFIETSGLPHVNPTSGHVTYKMDIMWTYLRWANIFAILWLSAFVIACQDMVIAGAVARWYFIRDKSTLGWPIVDSIKILIRYHLGSIALGSFIIALVQMARVILGYIQNRVKGRASKVAEFILKCLQCCLWCFERFLKFLNRNAYIEIAIYGDSFCTGARKAFTMILSNVLRVAAINSIGDFVLFLGKLCTVGVVLIIGNEAFLKARSDVNYAWVPLSVSCIVSYAIAHCFLLVYEITIDTIFLCFCEDSERNDGVSTPYFMSKNLMKLLSGTSIAVNQTGNNSLLVREVDSADDLSDVKLQTKSPENKQTNNSADDLGDVKLHTKTKDKQTNNSADDLSDVKLHTKTKDKQTNNSADDLSDVKLHTKTKDKQTNNSADDLSSDVKLHTKDKQTNNSADDLGDVKLHTKTKDKQTNNSADDLSDVKLHTKTTNR